MYAEIFKWSFVELHRLLQPDPSKTASLQTILWQSSRPEGETDRAVWLQKCRLRRRRHGLELARTLCTDPTIKLLWDEFLLLLKMIAYNNNSLIIFRNDCWETSHTTKKSPPTITVVVVVLIQSVSHPIGRAGKSALSECRCSLLLLLLLVVNRL